MTEVRIVHFGPGAFHRAHQADYVDRLCRIDPGWGIAAAALRSTGTIEALRRQQGRYTLAILGETPEYRPIDVHRRLFGPDDRAGLRAQLTEPGVELVTATVTEKGYCLAPDGQIDFAHPDIVHDLADPDRPVSLAGWLALALADRRAAGVAPFSVLSCDNMTGNGRKLRSAVIALAGRRDAELARWIAGEAVFPDTMVDSITPATDDALRARVRAACGWDDLCPVQREPYAAWVIEDILPRGAPELAEAGVILTGDVAGWERAKLRILNGPHSALAYLGLLAGHETVAGAMADPQLAATVARMMADEIIPATGPGSFDLTGYSADILERFRNPAIAHQLAQIAWDGSQKLRYRLLDTMADALKRGTPFALLARAVAAWIVFAVRESRAGRALNDPLAGEISARALDPAPAAALLGWRAVFPAALVEVPAVRTAIIDAACSLAGEAGLTIGG
ncbi:mannitol dehydrogenase family protein [Sphingomonas changnyeongensis]|uniref:Mannitol dehydrogenase family protein n=1 Tax=Sphingomonas changnyeongensis TaxID=2698679 RepID=A0A7Z2NWI1_9SPHN|nr:mannitol dehydrogenase family protein [Sphingomonas changnyeongensis]QHL91128.1 mannitol dehydrogenase family protein [Sphingomonas changnyeongensis]